MNRAKSSISSTIAALMIALPSAVRAHDLEGHKHEHVKGGWNAKAGFVSDVDIRAKLWNQRGKSLKEIRERARIVAELSGSARTADEIAKDKETMARYRDAVVINSLMPGFAGIQKATDEHMRDGLKINFDAGVTLVSGSVYAYPGVNDVSMEDTIERSNAVLKDMNV